MKKLSAFFLWVLFASPIISQNKLWIGSNTALNYDHYKMNDPAGQLSDRPAIAGLLGLNIERDLSEIFTVGSGIHFKNYSAKAKYMNSYEYARSFNSLQIPIYLKAGKYFNNRLYKLNLIAGGTYVFNMNYGNNYYSPVGGSFFGFSSIVFNNFEINGNLKRSFILFHAGGGVAFTILKKCKLELNIIRHIGFSDVTKVDINYSISGIEAPPAKMISKGGFTATSFQFFYPLGNMKN